MLLRIDEAKRPPLIWLTLFWKPLIVFEPIPLAKVGAVLEAARQCQMIWPLDTKKPAR